MTVTEAISAFFLHCQFEKNLSTKTIKAYRIDLAQFTEWLPSQGLPMESIKQIDRDVVKAYLQTLFDFKPKTTKRKIATLKALFNFLEFEDHIVVNPFRKIKLKIREPRQLPTVMTVKEVQKIFAHVYALWKAEVEAGLPQQRARLRDLAVLELLFATGIRVAELSHLRPQEVNLEEGFIRVIGKGSKERLLHIGHDSTVDMLRLYFRTFQPTIESANYFFVNRLGNRLSEQSVRLMVRKYAEAVQLPKHITPHIFRHTFATLLLQEEVDIRFIQGLLGHASINTTQIYAHINPEHQRTLLRTRHPRRLFQ
ncbi:MAG TPA: integrase [Cytophagales bacterium]|nr:integrase [Cytophagales bacterium]HAA22787.1 integrase [Cytophagales bacterium]HAP63999.1 integrase [Cytophagales bacterium]